MIIRDALRLLRRSWKPLLLFELTVQLLSLVLVVPLVGILIECTIQLAGLRYLTRANLELLIHSIWAVPLLLILVLLSGLYMLLQCAGVITCLAAAKHRQTLTPQDVLRSLASSLRRFYLPGMGSLLLYLLLLVPAVILSATSGLISSLGIPDLVTYYISNPDILFPVYLGITLLCILLCTPHLFALPIYVTRESSYLAARRHAAKATKGHRLRMFLGLLLWNVLYLTALLVLLCLLAWAGIGLISLLGGSVLYEKMPLRVLRYLLLGVVFLFSSGAIPCFGSVMMAYYFRFTDPDFSGSAIQRKPVTPRLLHFPKNRKILRTLCLLVASVLLVTNATYLYRTYSGTAALRFVFSVEPKIIAHRGYSAKAPENTSYAFAAAAEAGADGIELDIQQTADGVPVIAHDNNLKRISGWNQKISGVSRAELADLDVGSWFGADFSDARILTLEELLDTVDESLFLNIELKTEATSPELEHAVVDLIRSHQAEHRCCITSFSYPALKRIKEYCPDIRTGFLMSYAYGNFYTLEAADAFSIKSMFINQQMVNLAHENGKEIYAWTVNSVLEIQRMINLGADHIITDQPKLARKQLLRSSTEDTLFRAVVRMIS